MAVLEAQPVSIRAAAISGLAPAFLVLTATARTTRRLLSIADSQSNNPTNIQRKFPMKKTMILICSLIGLLVATSRAADVAGQWRAEFDTQIGVQKYLFTFQT